MRTNEAANHGDRFPGIYTIRADDQLVSFFHSIHSFILNIGERSVCNVQWEIPRDPWNFPFGRYIIPNTAHKLNIRNVIDRPIRPWTSTHEKKNRKKIARRSPTVTKLMMIMNWLMTDTLFWTTLIQFVIVIWLFSFVFRFIGIIQFVMHW